MSHIPITELPAAARARAEAATCPRCGGNARYYDTTSGRYLCGAFHPFRDEPPRPPRSAA